jgi:hypothetical protein
VSQTDEFVDKKAPASSKTMQAVVVLARNYWNQGDFSGAQRKH